MSDYIGKHRASVAGPETGKAGSVAEGFTDTPQAYAHDAEAVGECSIYEVGCCGETFWQAECGRCVIVWNGPRRAMHEEAVADAAAHVYQWHDKKG